MAGTVPVSALLYKYKSFRLVAAAKPLGMVPVNRLSDRYKNSMGVVKMVAGMVPTNRLLDKSTYCKRVKDAKASVIVPVKPVALAVKMSDDILDRIGGKDGNNEWSDQELAGFFPQTNM
jgi:hypothetical protein